jgi:hypothetical protein
MFITVDLYKVDLLIKRRKSICQLFSMVYWAMYFSAYFGIQSVIAYLPSGIDGYTTSLQFITLGMGIMIVIAIFPWIKQENEVYRKIRSDSKLQRIEDMSLRETE